MDRGRRNARLIEEHQLQHWRESTLEFFTTRAPEMATNWSPRVVRDLSESVARADWELLIAVNALTQPAVSEYFRRLPRLVERELNANWSRQDVITAGRVKGVVDFEKTARARAHSGSSLTVAYRKLERLWDTDENRAMAGFLAYAERVGRLALRTFGAGPWQETLASSVRQMRTALVATPLRFVQPDPAWPTFVLQPLRHTRSNLYWQFRQVGRGWARARLASGGAALRETLLGGWLKPATDDALFETFLVSRLVEALYHARDWDTFRISPVGLDTRLVEGTCGDLVATISFDASPSKALGRPVKGHYKWVFDTYDGLDLSARRPDITLQVRALNEVVTFFEAKATDANSQYGRDSIYKCLGYLKDFEAIWEDSSPCVVLCFASGVFSQVPLAARVDRDLILTSDPSLSSDFDTIVGRALALAS
jgi:hypothetical protein